MGRARVRIAVVVRGPMGSGKTTLIAALGRRLDRAGVAWRKVSLDKGWCRGEFRFRGGPGRYRDLRGGPEALIVELGFGEPQGGRRRGATRRPEEWASVLKKARRETVLVRLSLPWSVRSTRIVGREGSLRPARPWKGLYGRSSPCLRVAGLLGMEELVVRSTSRREVLSQVWRHVSNVRYGGKEEARRP